MLAFCLFFVIKGNLRTDECENLVYGHIFLVLDVHIHCNLNSLCVKYRNVSGVVNYIVNGAVIEVDGDGINTS